MKIKMEETKDAIEIVAMFHKQKFVNRGAIPFF